MYNSMTPFQQICDVRGLRARALQPGAMRARLAAIAMATPLLLMSFLFFLTAMATVTVAATDCTPDTMSARARFLAFGSPFDLHPRNARYVQ
jgi:hypothetical protein